MSTRFCSSLPASYSTYLSCTTGTKCDSWVSAALTGQRSPRIASYLCTLSFQTKWPSSFKCCSRWSPLPLQWHSLTRSVLEYLWGKTNAADAAKAQSQLLYYKTEKKLSIICYRISRYIKLLMYRRTMDIINQILFLITLGHLIKHFTGIHFLLFFATFTVP